MQRSAEDIEVARARAAKDLTNIDSDERRRRVIFGSIVTVSLQSGSSACAALVFACMSLYIIFRHSCCTCSHTQTPAAAQLLT